MQKGLIRAKILIAIGTLLMIVGIVLALSPLLTNIVSDVGEPLSYTNGIDDSYVAEYTHVYQVDTPYRVILPDPKPQPDPELVEGIYSVLAFPTLDLSLNVGYGIDTKDLEQGPSFYPQSEHPILGNTVIAGHRTTYGAPFRHLDQLKEDDPIQLLYDDILYIYEVTEVFPTHPNNWGVVDPSSEPILTLTTCHPPGWATQRLIVRALLVEVIEDWREW